MIRKIFFMLALALISNAPSQEAYGQSKEQIFSLANLSFADGRYNEAIDGYIKIIKKGIINPDVYYNLGNAYVKTGDAGRAILNYERSLELAPGNEDVIHNLSLVRKQVSGEESVPESGNIISRIITLDQSSGIVIFFYCMTFLALTVRTFSADEKFRQNLIRFTGAFTVITLFSAAVAGIQIYNQERADYGIVVMESAPVYEVPMEKGEPLASMSAGAKLAVMDSDAGWLKVATPAGLVGWVKSETTGLI